MPVTDIRFTCTKLFCIHCLTSDHFFICKDRKDWGYCPNHPDVYEVIMWQDMSKEQRDIAAEKFNKMWEQENGCRYTNL